MLEKLQYSAFPAGNNARQLLLEYRKLLLTNLLECIRSIEIALKLNLQSTFTKYQRIDVDRNFSPAVYHLFSKIINGTSLRNIQTIIDSLHGLNHLKEDEIYDSNFQLSTILTEQWEIEFINKLRNDHIPNKNNDITLILPILSTDLSVYETAYNSIIENIKRLDLDFHQEIESYVTRLKLFNGKGLKAATSASVFGAIYLKLPLPDENIEVYLLEHVIHETSHLQLDILLAFDKIVLNDDTEKYQAPIRVDNRPMFGIFHATFVLCRMIRLFQKIILDNPRKGFSERLDTFKIQFNKGLETIEKHAILTENGQLIKESFISASMA